MRTLRMLQSEVTIIEKIGILRNVFVWSYSYWRD